MNHIEPAPHETTVSREIVRWGLCLAIVLVAHGAGALALFAQRDHGDVSDAAPVAIEFISLPMPNAPLRDIAPGLEQVQSEAAPLISQKMPDVVREVDTVTETKPVRMAEAPPVRPVPNARPTPVQDARPIEPQELRPVSPDPVHVPDLLPVPNAEVALATLTPLPPPMPVDEVKEEKEPEEEKTAVPVAPSVAVAVTTAPTSATINSASLVSWRSRISSHLQRYKRYPDDARARREEGTAQVRFTVDRGGKIVAAVLLNGSGSGSLDAESVAMLRRAEPLPRPPDDIPGSQFSFTVPVRFAMK